MCLAWKKRVYLDGTAVDQQSIQLAEGLASSIGMVKGNVGEATANTTGAV
jgi:hypothetical protein